jgi:phosphate transport system permease protein
MQLLILAIVLLALTAAGFRMGRGRALALAGGRPRSLHSLPSHYGTYVALWCGIPAVIVVAFWLALEPLILKWLVVGALPPEIQALPPERLQLVMNDIRNLASGTFRAQAGDPVIMSAAAHYNSLRTTGFVAMAVAGLAIGLGGLSLGWRLVSPVLEARTAIERTLMVVLIISSTVAVFTTVGIVLSLLFEAMRFFQAVSVWGFVFGLEWSPQTAIRADQVGSSGSFGAVPLFAGTLLITIIAMVVAVPIGLMSAIYMAEYAAPRLRTVVKPALEILAGIPTVVYGFFAALTVAPFVRDTGATLLGLNVSSESALAAGFVMGIMIIPFVSSLSDDVIAAVPQSLREGSYGLGATHSETIRLVVLPAALPGIVGGILLGVSRAIGETMIVVMAAGLAANLTANPLQAVTTVTVQIVTLLIGDQEFDSPKTLAAFALGLMLFVVTLILNIVALGIVKAFRERYD